MGLDELIIDLIKFLKFEEQILINPKEDERYKYAESILKYLKELRKMKGEM